MHLNLSDSELFSHPLELCADFISKFKLFVCSTIPSQEFSIQIEVTYFWWTRFRENNRRAYPLKKRKKSRIEKKKILSESFWTLNWSGSIVHEVLIVVLCYSLEWVDVQLLFYHHSARLYIFYINIYSNATLIDLFIWFPVALKHILQYSICISTYISIQT